MSKMAYTQDMPPPGGYNNISWEKSVPKKAWPASVKFGMIFGATVFGWVAWYQMKKIWKMRKIEMMDARYAVKPIILAEQHRHMMRHWRKNRDYENELMKDVPGWTTGTLYGEPVFYNVRGRYVQPSNEEYYAHNSIITEYNHLMEKSEH